MSICAILFTTAYIFVIAKGSNMLAVKDQKTILLPLLWSQKKKIHIAKSNLAQYKKSKYRIVTIL